MEDRLRAVAAPSVSRSALEVRRSHAAARRALFGDDIPVTIGRYELNGRIGLGGMGIVYSARDSQLDRDVAIKVVHPGRVEADAEAERARLLAEARNLARVSSAHVVEVLDVGTHDDQVYFAMELADGPTLAAWLQQQRRDAGELVAVFSDAARGLADAHSLGVVHGDVKPSNIVISTHGRRASARLIDFGLGSSGPDGPTAGAGTPAFMAPEVRAGGQATAAADQYSLCVALREAFDGTGLPRRVRRVVARGTREDPSQRWPSLLDVATALDRGSDDRGGFATAVTGALGVTAALGLWWIAPQSTESACPPAGAERWKPPQLGSNVPPAVQAHLEAYVANLETSRDHACESGNDRARACLQRRNDRLSGLLELDATAVDSDAWTLAVVRLDPPARCLDASGSTLDASVAADVERARAVVSTLPQSQQAEDEAVAALVRAQEEAPSAVADALLVLGELWRARGRVEDAATAFERAATQAEVWHHDRVAAEALCARTGLELYERSNYEGARVWLRHAQAAVARTRAPDLEGQLRRLSGLLALHTGELEQAADHFAASRAALSAWYGDEHVALAGVDHDLGSMYAERRELEPARRHLKAALDRWEQEYGEHHPILATAYTSLGAVAEYGADYDEAILAYDKALDALEGAGAQWSTQAATVSFNSANTLYRVGRYEEASKRFEEAADSFSQLNPDHPKLGHVHIGLGNVARDERRWDDAAEHFDEATDRWRAALGPDHMLVALALSSAAEARLSQDRGDEAEPLLRESIRIREAQRGPSDPSIAYPLTTLGRLLHQRDRLPEANASLTRALELRRSKPDIDERLLAETEFALAKLRRTQGRDDEAHRFGEAARDHFDGPWPYAKDDVAMVQRWLDAR